VGHLINSDSTLVNDRDFLNSLFIYSDGDLFWKKNNKKAGNVLSSGYIAISIGNLRLRLHRIVYVMHNGPIPDSYQVHHKDSNQRNNRIDLLECVSTLKHGSLRHIHKKKITFNEKSKNWECTKDYNKVRYLFKSKSKSGVSKIVNNFLECIKSEGEIERFSKYAVRQKRKNRKHWSHYFEPTQESLKKYFVYQDGGLYQKYNMQRIGTLYNNGYILASICKKRYGIHRLIYIYHYGEIPDGLVIDHIDHNKENNDISNLRAVSKSVNSLNSRKTKDLKILGKTKGNKWRVRVKVKGHPGEFCKSFTLDQKQEAIEFRKQMLAVREDYDALRELYGHSD
jgi:hypothetical protein